jgi:hypothetical protein
MPLGIEATVKKTTPKGRWRFGCSARILVPASNSKGAEEHIGEEVVEFDHDDGGDGEPDRRKYRSCGEKLFHGLEGWGLRKG